MSDPLFKNINGAVVQLSPEEEAAVREQWAAEDAKPPAAPRVVGKGQGTVWLHRAGKLDAIEAYIAGSDDAELRLWWANCTEFHIDNPYVVSLAAGFGIDLETAFREAAAIDG